MTSIFDERLKAKSGKHIAAGRAPISQTRKDSLRSMVSGTPETMVKLAAKFTKDKSGKLINTSPTNKDGLRKLVTYLGKDGNEVTDEQGNTFAGDELLDATAGWAGIPERGTRRMEVRHLILSMPAGTPYKETENAAALFVADEFAGHQFLIAHHRDTPRPHSHVAIRVRSIDGLYRLCPVKDDLKRWREKFAEQLKWQGIDAAATSKLDRLSSRNNLSQNEYRWLEKQGGDALENRKHGKLHAGHVAKVREHKDTIAELSHGSESDRQLAEDLSTFVSARLEKMNVRNQEVSHER